MRRMCQIASPNPTECEWCDWVFDTAVGHAPWMRTFLFVICWNAFLVTMGWSDEHQMSVIWARLSGCIHHALNFLDFPLDFWTAIRSFYDWQLQLTYQKSIDCSNFVEFSLNRFFILFLLFFSCGRMNRTHIFLCSCRNELHIHIKVNSSDTMRRRSIFDQKCLFKRTNCGENERWWKNVERNRKSFSHLVQHMQQLNISSICSHCFRITNVHCGFKSNSRLFRFDLFLIIIECIIICHWDSFGFFFLNFIPPNAFLVPFGSARNH